MSAFDTLFARWLNSYPESQRSGFHKDGIIDEASYARESVRVVFILLEPNSTDGAYDRFRGRDLREVFLLPMKKEINRNLTRWTGFLIDGNESFGHPSPQETSSMLRRVAIVNLKKISGSGTADYIAIAQHAWKDREFLREQLALIAPGLVVTCSEEANRLFGQVVSDDLNANPPADRMWTWNGINVLPGNHPSLRPTSAEAAYQRLIRRYRGQTDEVAPLRAKVSQRVSPLEGAVPRVTRTSWESTGAWIFRPYPHHTNRFNEFLRESMIALGWPGVGDLRRFDRASLRARLGEVYQESERGRAFGGWIGTLLTFRDRVREGDLVVVAPFTTDSSRVAIARIIGPYDFVAAFDGVEQAYAHRRPVQWVTTDVPRIELPVGVSRSLKQGIAPGH